VKRLKDTLLLALALLTFLTGFFAFGRQLESMRPLGFFVEEKAGVSVVTQIEAGGNAELAGVMTKDVVAGVNGRRGDWAALKEEILANPAGVTLELRRRGQRVEIFYQPPPKRLDLHYLIFAFIGGVFLAVGLVTFLQRRYFLTRLFFFVMMGGFTLLAVVPAGKVNDLWRTLFGYRLLMECLLPAAILQLLLYHPRSLAPPRTGRWLPFLYLPGSVLFLLLADGLLLGGRFGVEEEALMAIYDGRTAYLILYLAGALALFGLQWAAPKKPLQRQRWNWVLIGSLGLLPYLLLEMVPGELGLDLGLPVWALAIPIVLFPLGFSSSILNLRLGDVGTVFRNVASSLLAFLSGLLLYLLVNLFAAQIFPEEMQASRNFFLFVAGFAIALLLLFLKGRWDAVIDRLAGSRQAAVQRMAADLAESMAFYTDPDALLRHLFAGLKESMGVQRCNFYLPDGTGWARKFPDPVLPERVEGAAVPPFAPPWTAFPLALKGQALGVLVASPKEGNLPLAHWERGLLRNITGQLSLYFQNLLLMKRLEEKLKELEFHQQFLESVFQYSPLGILVVRQNGGLISANPKARELLGAAGPGYNFFAAFPDYAPGTPEATLIAGGGRTLLAAQGTLRFSGEVNYLILLNDISEQVTLQEELKQKEKLAILGQLAATIAHEINTPLTGIASYAQMLQPLFAPGTPERRRFAYIQEQSFHVARVVTSLLEFSRSQKRAASAVPLREAVGQALRILEPRLAEHGFSVALDPALPDLTVAGDPVLLPQAFTNLILNACDAVQWKGTVAVAWEDGGDEALVTVRDDGPGMPEDLREKVLQPFVTTKGAAGTGLGLTLSHAIIMSLGGRMTIDTAGRGTTVQIRLPYEHSNS
jgi:hypothetical protein